MTQSFTPYLSARSAATSGLVNASALVEVSAGLQYFQVNVPSRASNAANSIVPIGRADQAISVVSAYMIPQSSQAGSATNYDDISIINLSSDGAGTVVVASKTFSAAGASVSAGSAGSFALNGGASASVAAGQALAASYTSAGNGIAIVAHTIEVAYRRA